MSTHVYCLVFIVIICHGALSDRRVERAATQKPVEGPPKYTLKETDIYVLKNPSRGQYWIKEDRNCTFNAVDLAFVVDESNSIGPNHFPLLLHFLVELVKSMFIGTTDDKSKVALVKFNEHAVIPFNLNTFPTNEQVYNAILRTSYDGGATNIAGGMVVATNQIFNSANGDRPNVGDVMIVITDGHDDSDVAKASQDAAAKKITVYAIGVGPDVNQTQLVKIAGDPKRVFNVATFTGLDSILDELCQHVNPPSTTPRPTITTTIGPQSPTNPSQCGCQNGGTWYCQCPPGYTGRHCEIAPDTCNEIVHTSNGDITVPLCGPHGTCYYNSTSGSYCICHHGWTGPTCNEPNPSDVQITNRCYHYFGAPDPYPNCTGTHRCLLDNLDCAYQLQGCPKPAPGWCLPVGVVRNIITRLGIPLAGL